MRKWPMWRKRKRNYTHKADHSTDVPARDRRRMYDEPIVGVAECYGPDGERLPEFDAPTLTWPWSRLRGRPHR